MIPQPGAEIGAPPRLDDNFVRSEQVRLLYRNAGAALLVNFFNAGLLALAVADIAGLELVLWLVALAAVTLARALLVRAYRRSATAQTDPEPWARRYVVGATLAGTLWGLAGIVMVNEGTMVHQAFAAFILGGMSAGAIATSASVMAAYLTFALPALLPVAVIFLVQGDRLHLIMGAMTLVFAAALLATARHAAGLLRGALALQLDNARINAELSRHREDLERLVEARTAELAAANQTLREREAELRDQADRLADADRRKDEFLALLSHELRNPLAPIRNSLEVVKLKGSPDPSAQAACDMIDRQVAHMVRLIDDLLDVSRITQGKLQLRKERVELVAVLEQVLESVRPLIACAGHDLSAELPEQPLHLDADPVRLAQVFFNLLDNACKYTEQGGRIRLSAERIGTEVAVKVEDTGIGIPVEHLPRVFEPFTQTPSASGDMQTGLGIGLSLTSSLVKMHGGRIEARSDGPGRGSTFTVWLPLSSRSPDRQTAQAQMPEAQDTTASRILVVDDQADVAESLAVLLRLHGHEVHTARDGLEAVATAERIRPDLVLLDIGMPRLDGFGACRQMRAQPWGKDLTIIALTGWGQDSDYRKTEEAGFDGHLVKPVDPSEVLQWAAQGRADTA